MTSTNISYAHICKAESVGYLTPPSDSTYLSRLSTQISHIFSFVPNGDTSSYYVGIIAIIFSVFGLPSILRTPHGVALGVSGIVVYLFSLGPYSSSSLYSIFSQFPFLNLIDCPVRFAYGAQFVISIFAVYGLSQLLSKISSSKVSFFIVGVISLFLFIEYFPKPLPISSTVVPEIYYAIARNSDSKTVFELPSGLTESKRALGYDWSLPALHSKQMYWQAVYSKPRIGGYMSRIDQSTYDFFNSDPVMKEILAMIHLGGVYPVVSMSPEDIRTYESTFNIGYYVLSPNSRQEMFSRFIETNFSGRYVRESFQDGYILYTIR